jgi:ribosomal protein S18 acetylase RimI-like enzyme
MSELIVRRYRGSDRDEVVILWWEVFGEGSPWNDPDYVIARKTTVQADLFFIGEIDGAVVATVLAGYDGVRGWIYSLAVAPAHRLRGFGTRMVRAAESALLDLGCPKINLQVRAGNEQVVGFYRRLGYEVEDRVSMGRSVPPKEL